MFALLKYNAYYLLTHLSFITGDGRWRQVIRRCASVADTGVTGVCNWGVKENGVYWEECYCSQDGCNGSSHISLASFLTFMPFTMSILWRWL
jgi:hypothetical protein